MARREWKRCGMGLWVRYISPQDYAELRKKIPTGEDWDLGYWWIFGELKSRSEVR